MILIISEDIDHTTNKVLEWLYSNGACNVLRLNTGDKVMCESVSLANGYTEIILKCETKGRIKLSEINFFWYRRGSLSPWIDSFEFNTKLKEQQQFSQFLNWEINVIKNFILYELQKKKSLGSYFKSVVNKLANLEIAKECGFEIPATLISGEIQQLKHFAGIQPVITKPISEAVQIGDPDAYINPLTTEIDPETDFTPKDTTIFPSLLQSKIEKWVEIRVFVMYDEIYSMAIFSQNNHQTTTDFRDYDFNQMNRMVPFCLPQKIRKQVSLFMEKSGLNTGSIDMILSKTGKYVFLEINPAGNIEMVSDNCNYNIEQRIASRIIKEKRHEHGFN